MLTSRRRPSQRITPALRLIMATGAHDTLIDVAHQLLGDALEIESAARIRLADEYDAAQERGEVQRPGGDRKTILANDKNDPTVADLGLRHDQFHEARRLRDAEEAQPGIVAANVREMLRNGDEPTAGDLAGLACRSGRTIAKPAVNGGFGCMSP